MRGERKRLKSISYSNNNVGKNFFISNGGRNMIKEIYRKTILFSQMPTHGIQCSDKFRKIRNKCFSENWNRKVEIISDKYLDWTKIQIPELGNATFL